MSERLADELADQAELMAAFWASRSSQNIDLRAAVDYAAVGAWRPAAALLAAAGNSPSGSASSLPGPSALAWEQAARERAQADLLRCVLGPLPFRTPEVDPDWQTPLVLALAQEAYDKPLAPDAMRPGWLVLDPARLLVPGDALEDAGCTDTELLSHLCDRSPHIRGCFAVDALSGRK